MRGIISAGRPPPSRRNGMALSPFFRVPFPSQFLQGFFFSLLSDALPHAALRANGLSGLAPRSGSQKRGMTGLVRPLASRCFTTLAENTLEVTLVKKCSRPPTSACGRRWRVSPLTFERRQDDLRGVDFHEHRRHRPQHLCASHHRYHHAPN
jgi:hypothetical protein